MDDTIPQKVIAAAETIVPGFSNDIEFVGVRKWGPVSPCFRPGDYENLGRFVQQRKKYKRVKLAGDYYATTNMNTAVTAGERATREIVQQFC